MYDNLMAYLDHWATDRPSEVWLRDRRGDELSEWNWQRAREEIHAVASWQENALPGKGHRVGILSRNRAHWFLADYGSIAAGNVVILNVFPESP